MSESEELKARKVRDNGDGTETWMAPVEVPSELIKDHEVVAVRPIEPGDKYIQCGSAGIFELFGSKEPRIIVRPIPKPTWTPPASLKPGRYKWDGNYIGGSTSINARWARHALRDWTDPPAVGWWVVNDNGTATFEGE